MAFNLRNRSFVKEVDFTPKEWKFLLDLAAELKRAKYAGTEQPRLTGKNIALIFEKTSTRTRCAFEVAAFDQGARVTYLDPSGSQIGHKESMEDTARVLGRMYDGIEYRGSAQTNVETLAEYAGVPVWNGLTDEWHPTQMLCDMLTMREHCDKHDSEIAFAYLGDARNNVGNSLLIAGAMMGMDVRIVAPQVALEPRRRRSTRPARSPRRPAPGSPTPRTSTTASPASTSSTPTCGCRWASRGGLGERIELLRPYQVNMAVVKATGNPKVKFMHCLPAFHDRHTKVGEELFQQTGMDALEVTDEVFESRHSIVFDQAENRMHTIKAVLVATLGA